MTFREADAIISGKVFDLARIGNACLRCTQSAGRLDLMMESSIAGGLPRSIGLTLMFDDLDDFELKLKMAINRAKAAT